MTQLHGLMDTWAHHKARDIAKDTKGKRSKDKGLRNVLDETETNEEVPVAGPGPVPVRRTEEHR